MHLLINFPVFILLLHCTCICRKNKHYSDFILILIHMPTLGMEHLISMLFVNVT